MRTEGTVRGEDFHRGWVCSADGPACREYAATSATRAERAIKAAAAKLKKKRRLGDAFGVGVDAAKSLVARSRRSRAHAVASEKPRKATPGRRRHLLLVPSWMIERMRDAATFATYHEQPASLVTKACAAVTGSSGGAAVVAVVPPDPRVIAVVERDEPRKRERARQARPAAAVPYPLDDPGPHAPAAAGGGTAQSGPTPTPTPAATAEPSPTPGAEPAG